MNIALFLTPKSEVVTLHHNHSIAEAMTIMKDERYATVPVIDSKGRYKNAISEGDILWFIKDHGDNSYKELAHLSIRKIQRHHDIKSVSIDSNMDSLIDLVSAQSFVPVVDDDNVFIGIIKRSDIISYTLADKREKTKVLVS